MAESLQLVWDLIARDNASGTFRKVGTEAEGASGAVGKLVGGFTALAVGGAIAASVKAASEFQAQMLLVQTQAGATSKEVADMSPKILALAGQVAQAPEALATSLYHVESTGLRGAQALEAVKIAAEGAKVGHADLEETTNALTATIASGMLPATETYTQAMGQLNTIVGSGDMKMSDLNQALASGLLVTTKQYGITINDVGAALADFGDNNIRGADAATQLRMAVQAIAKPGIDAGFYLAKIGLTVKQLQSDEQTGGLNKVLIDLHQHLVDSGVQANQWGEILTGAFTKKAGSGLLTLIGTFDRFQQKYQEVSKGADSFGDAWAATTKTASFQFSALKDSIDAVGIRIGTALLPPLGDLAHWFSATGIPAVEGFWSSVQKFTQSQGFQSFLRDVETLGMGAWHTLQQVSGVLVDLGKVVLPPVVSAGGDLLHLFTELPGPVQLAVGAFAALRIAAAKGIFDGVVSGAGAVGAAFRGFGADVSATRGVLEGAGVPLAGFSATLQTTAERGMGALKSAGSGVMNMLGGPWGASLLGAGLAVAAVTSKFQDAAATEDKWTAALKAGGQAADDAKGAMLRQQQQLAENDQGFMGFINRIDGYSAAQRAAAPSTDRATQAFNDWYTSLHGADKAQEDVTLAMAKYNQQADQYGPNSAQARAASDQLKTAQDGLATAQERENRAQKTHIDMLHDQAAADGDAITQRLQLAQASAGVDTSLAQLNIDTAKGKGFTGDLAGESNNLALQMIGVAKQAGQAAAAQAKANGVTDDGTIANQAQLDWLKKVADQITGPGHDAILEYMNDLGKANVQHGSLNDAIDKMKLNVAGTWDSNTKVIQGATKQEIQDLKNLGLNVLELPGMPGHPAQILVTANTDAAYNTLNAFAQKAQKLGFVGAIFNVAPLAAPSSNPGGKGGGGLIGMPPIGRATGGSITGPGTGTSDSILVAASNGEHMWTAKEVAAAGGHGAVESLRKAVLASGGGRANGGAIYPVDWNAAAMKQANNYLATAFAPSAGGNATNRALGQRIAAAMGYGGQFSAIDYVFSHESGWNNLAQNPTSTAFGIPQFLASTWKTYGGKTTDPAAQILAGLEYMRDRYGSPNGAASFWQQHHWYDNGGWLQPGATLAMNGTGKPERIRTADQEAALQQQLSGSQQITLQLDGDAVTDLLDGRVVTALSTIRTRMTSNP